ncbi:hypothetical protein PV327_007253 [Microctonus hyperodae]|uniref:Mitochondrial ribonuclease P catalytic subunit n=1 Tax=Microctonus hyperodae TaxID=165561 RepID=A0AA39KJ99_MICHY|nr:hypothetical protein PV327_007253 [Microctonus hyperodae]
MSIFKLRPVNLKFIRYLCTERQNLPQSAGKPFFIRQQENLLVNHVLQTNERIENDKWMEIRKELLFNPNLRLSEHNVDSVILDLCCDVSNKSAAKDYIEFLRNTNHEINIAVLGKYFKILFKSKTPLSAEETKILFESYDKIRAKYPILDTRTAEACILGLSKTSRWKECYDLLEMYETNDQTGTIVFASIVAGAFDHDEPDKAWKLLKSMQTRIKLYNFVLESYLNYCIRQAKNSNELEILLIKMFKFWSEYDYYPEEKMIDMYMNCFKDIKKWSIRKTSIKHNGTCVACGCKLYNLEESSDDFDNLSNSFLSKVLVGGDIYNNTTPKELENFKRFVNATKPYDVVIDGLNAAYACNKDRVNYTPVEKLVEVVKAFVAQNKKIFVLGRCHMRKWSSQEMNYIKRHAHLFLAKDSSADDPFMLYATFTSGINTYFASRDFMRQHRYILNDEYLRRIFRHWQFTRQIQPTMIGGPHNRQLILIEPPEFLPIAQQNQNGDWHIPYFEETIYKEMQLSDRPRHWLCLKKNQ